MSSKIRLYEFRMGYKQVQAQPVPLVIDTDSLDPYESKTFVFVPYRDRVGKLVDE